MAQIGLPSNMSEAEFMPLKSSIKILIVENDTIFGDWI